MAQVPRGAYTPGGSLREGFTPHGTCRSPSAYAPFEDRAPGSPGRPEAPLELDSSPPDAVAGAQAAEVRAGSAGAALEEAGAEAAGGEGEWACATPVWLNVAAAGVGLDAHTPYSPCTPAPAGGSTLPTTPGGASTAPLSPASVAAAAVSASPAFSVAPAGSDGAASLAEVLLQIRSQQLQGMAGVEALLQVMNLG